MLETKVVQVTGRGSNVNLDIDDSAPFDSVVEGIRNHLLANRSMYSRGTITVNVGRRMLDKEELTRIKQVIEKESGVTVSRFWCPPQILEEALSRDMGFGVAISPREAPPRPEPARREIAHNDPGFSQKPPTSQPAGTDGLELWAPYIKEVSHLVQEADAAAGEDAAAIAGPHSEVSSVTPEGGVAEENAGEGAGEPAVTGADFSANIEEPGPVAVPAAEGGQPQGAKEGGTSHLAVIATRWKEVDRAEIAPARKTAAARQLSGLNRGNEALLIKTHCRSGEVIRYAGDVVVMADVNPGSKIIADGDILVFGSLRGFAHAGAGGDIQATIIAQSFETPRLQIGPYEGVDPKPRKRSRSNSSNPRMAYVRRRSVYVAPYTGRFGEYSGGTLYDG